MAYAVIDTETTGFDPTNGDRLVEVAAVKVDASGTPTGATFHTYINPECPVPQAATDVHGLDNAFLDGMPTFKDVAQDFRDFIGGGPLVAHNLDFDLKFLRAEYAAFGEEAPYTSQALCTVQLARFLYPGAPASLGALVKRFDLSPPDGVKPSALSDAFLVAAVFRHFIAVRDRMMAT